MKLPLFSAIALATGLASAPVIAFAQQAVRYGEQAVGPERHAQALPTMGNDLFGDQINPFTGGVTFVQTDLALPGNSSIPVSLTRRLVVDGNKSPVEDQDVPLWKNRDFGEWEIDIPYMTGIYSSASGWVVDTTNPNARCSSPQSREQYAPKDIVILDTTFYRHNYWNGISLYVPGAGESPLLGRPPTSTTPAPATTTRTTMATKSNWHISCSAEVALKSGQPGEGFIALAPDGTKYFFDWMVEYPERPLIQAAGYAPTQEQIREMADYWGTYQAPSTSIIRMGPSQHLMLDAGGASYSNPDQQPMLIMATLPRTRIRIYPTHIEDRFGNEVSFIWSGSKLTEINSSDGRKITLQYQSNMVSSASDGTRTVNYHYTNGLLDVVTYPDASSWSLVTAPMLGIRRFVPKTITGPYEQQFKCQMMRKLTNDEAVITMTHPSGAQGEFKLGFKRHLRTGLDGSQSCGNGANYVGENEDAYMHFRTLREDRPESNMPNVPVLYDVLSVKQKTISGTGIAGADMSGTGQGSATWSYARGDSYGLQVSDLALGPGPAGSFPVNGTRTLTTTKPDGNSVVDVFGTDVEANEGNLLSEDVMDGTNVVSRTTNTYVQTADLSAVPFEDRIGMPLGVGQMEIGDANRPLKGRTIEVSGRRFILLVNTFDNLARPLSTTRRSEDVVAQQQPGTTPILSVPATALNGNFTASWGLVGDATSYTLEQSANGGAWTVAYSGSGWSKAFANVGAGSFGYRVKACNAGGCGSVSPTGTVQSLYPPSAPVLSAPAQSVTGNYTVSWATVATATSYRLEESANGGTWTQIQDAASANSAISGKGAGAFGYRARACNAAGCGTYSATATVTVTPPVPAMPGGFTAKYSVLDGPTSTRYVTRWLASTYATSYQVDGYMSYDGPNLTADRSYPGDPVAGRTFRVRACNPSGCSAWTPDIEAVPQ